MKTDGSTSPIPLPVHVGRPEPVPQAADPAPTGVLHTMLARHQRQSPFADPEFDWAGHGLEPRWLGMESGDCVAAFDPSIYHRRGDEELSRFLEGAAHRQEVALVIATMGNVNDQRPRPIGVTADATISLPGAEEYLSGARLPSAATITPAEGLGRADRDLALRLRDRGPDTPWWGLSLNGSEWVSGGGGPTTRHEATGRLDPILVDGLGRPVVATWTPADGSQRWYIVPDVCDWDDLLSWLVRRALVEYVPGALRRARSPLALDPAVQTSAENAAREALDELDAEYAERRQELQDGLEAARAQGEPVRYGLLYGTGPDLEQAVTTVLVAAGLTVVGIDELLGDTTSADLLVAYENERRLIEVKSASGSASETLVGQLERHLRTWPQLRPEDPVGGGVLVVNHEHRLEPGERGRAVYTRPEFVAALTVPVIATRALFDWWRAEDWTAMRDAIFGSDRDGSEHPAGGGLALFGAGAQVAPASGRRPRKLLMRLRRRDGPSEPDGSQ